MGVGGTETGVALGIGDGAECVPPGVALGIGFTAPVAVEATLKPAVALGIGDGAEWVPPGVALGIGLIPRLGVALGTAAGRRLNASVVDALPTKKSDVA